jgi:hypothetical protein
LHRTGHDLKLFADQENVQGQYHDGIWLLTDYIHTPNRKIAFTIRFRNLSAENDDPNGQFAAALISDNGIGIFHCIDFDTAIRYYQKCSGVLSGQIMDLLHGSS